MLLHVRVIAAAAVFLASYLVFALGKFPGMRIDRPGAAIIGAVLMFALRVLGPADAMRYIDFGTLVLLFSMMLIVGYLRVAGFFDWITETVIIRIRPSHLMPTVIFTAGVLSAFFVNDVICLVMAPFVLTGTRRMGLKPTPYLLALATASNIGSTATITGNPQNMLIGSFSRISYSHFMLRLGPVAAVGLLIDWLILSKLASPTAAADSVPREAAQPRFRPIDTSALRKPALVILLVLIGFLAGVPPSFMAALGAAMMLVTRTRDPRLAYENVDWGLLVFFVGLFLIVGGAESAGLIERVFYGLEHWNLQRTAIFTLVAVLFSNLVSNVPAVMLLKSLVPHFTNPHSGWLLLAMASTLAGNLTVTGSVANLIVLEAAKSEVKIGFHEYFRVGLPVTVLTVLFGWLWLAWT
jgi:Na+/H+ antiporter NhaD/arsenite permease-like protein